MYLAKSKGCDEYENCRGETALQRTDKRLQRTAYGIDGAAAGEAMAEYAEDLGKIMEVARRIMKGGIVAAADEKKLMDYSMEMYQAAKNMGIMARQKDREEYDSLWEEDEEGIECEDTVELADNTEAFAAGPELIEAADTVAAATQE